MTGAGAGPLFTSGLSVDAFSVCVILFITDVSIKIIIIIKPYKDFLHLISTIQCNGERS